MNIVVEIGEKTRHLEILGQYVEVGHADYVVADLLFLLAAVFENANNMSWSS